MRILYTITLLLVGLIQVMPAGAQNQLVLSYDNAGNRIKREVILTLMKRDTLTVNDSLPLDSTLVSSHDSIPRKVDNVVSLLGRGTVSVFPNPGASVLKMEFIETTVSAYTAILYDGYGNAVRKESYIGSKGEMDIADLQTAYYFLEIRTNSEKIIWKVIKQ